MLFLLSPEKKTVNNEIAGFAVGAKNLYDLPETGSRMPTGTNFSIGTYHDPMP